MAREIPRGEFECLLDESEVDLVGLGEHRENAEACSLMDDFVEIIRRVTRRLRHAMVLSRRSMTA